MVHGANRSGSRRKVHVRTTSGTVKRYEERKPGKAHCACGRVLPGTASGTRSDLSKLAKTEKRPSRPFGGMLCAVCSKAMLRQKARLSSE